MTDRGEIGTAEDRDHVPLTGSQQSEWERDELPDWFVHRRRTRTLLVARWVPWAMVGVPVLVLLAIVIYPTVWMAVMAFTDTNYMSLIQDNANSVGWGNFSRILFEEGGTSSRFWASVENLGVYLLFGACLQVAVGATLALILYEVVRSHFGRVVLLVILVMPMMLPPSIVGVLWKFLFQVNNGALNHLLINIGLMDVAERINWTGKDLALWSIIIADIWQWTALPLLIVFSGRVSLPPAIYEAARVDGASGTRVMFRVTLPMLREIIAIAFILRFMDAYKFIDLVYVLTQGGPAETSELPSYIAFMKGLREFQIGEAAAYSWIIFVGAAVLITLFLQYLKRVMKAQGVT